MKTLTLILASMALVGCSGLRAGVRPEPSDPYAFAKTFAAQEAKIDPEMKARVDQYVSDDILVIEFLDPNQPKKGAVAR